ncbi:MAG: response regulator transcription factor [Oscillospiraceae bacterium]|nr:response regulator transcription factor [Oscillospiraceae bacterium]
MSEIIAVIDDDLHINNMLCELLSREGYKVIRAFSGGEALAVLEETTPDLILLDLMMPGLSGEQVLPRIRDIPVIVMSAKVDVGSKVQLLMSGAADYVTKPFDTKELLARIQVQLRRSRQVTADILEYGGLTLDAELHEAKFGENAVKLTKTEFAILKILMQNPKQVITKSQILDRISADTPDCVESSLKVHVSNLRKKLRDASGLDFIEAVWGIGFKMRENLN